MNVEFVNLMRWHFIYILGEEEANKLNGKAIGSTLIDLNSAKPLGFGGVYFEENNNNECVAVAFLYGGPSEIYLKMYIVNVVREILYFCKKLLDLGVSTVYAVSDKKIKNSRKFLEWAAAKPTGKYDENGEIWVIHLNDVPLLKGRL